MKRLAVAVLFLSFFIPTAFAICNNCEPNPTSSTYQSTITQRPKSYNARRVDPGDGGPDDGGGGKPPAAAPQVFGSASYSYTIPILHFPGRNGLALDLTLYYNSRVWTRDVSVTPNTMTFNADRDWPSPGFRLGFGSIELSPNDSTYVVTEANGAKHSLAFTSSNNYNSTDSTYINYTPSTKVLIYKNGTRVTYEPFWVNNANSTTLFRPIQIKDTNGNFITISYVTHTEQSINTITDTLGRVVTFNYDSNSNLSTITDGFHTYTFAYGTTPLNYGFTGPVAKDTVAIGTNITVLTNCIYPNGTGYNFTYGDWGIVREIDAVAAPIAPSAGVTRASQSYNFPAYTPSLSDAPTYTQQTIYDGINTSVWTYGNTKSGNLISTVTVTDPSTANGPQKKVVTTLSTLGDFTQGLTTQTEVFDVTNGNKSMRKSVNSWVNTTNGPQLASVTTTNDAGQVAKVAYTYTTNGNVSSFAEYDYGPALIRTTSTTYLTTYTTQHILDRPTQVVIKGSGGNIVSRTDFAYDGSSLASQTGLTTHDDTNYPSTFTARGNLTRVTRYSNATDTGTAITRDFTYDMLGNPLSAQLDCCNTKTWTYDSTNYGLPITITRGSSPSLSTSATYDSYWRLLKTTDENGQTLTYSYDDANHTDRVITVTRDANTNDFATFSTSYDDTSAHPTTTSSNSVNNAVQKSFVETVGSTNRLRRDLYNGNDANPTSSVVSYIDAVGRTYKVSNPFGPSDTEIDTTTSFDALNRPVSITPPSGGNSQFVYAGNATQVVDPAGKTRKNFSDAFGRLIRVDEPGWADGMPSHATVTITGTEQNYGHWTVCDAKCIQLGGESVFIIDGYDTGTVTLTINGGAPATASYGQSSTPTSIATALVTAINSDSNQLVSAASTGASITLTSKDKDASANYPLSASVVYDMVHETHASFGVTLPSPAAMSGAQDATNGHGTNTPSLATPMSTGYVYDVLNDLTLVDQAPQTRTYQYDSLGRVTSVKVPETLDVSQTPPVQKATTFTYDDPGSGQVLKRTDPNGTQTNYTYDALNRLQTISYTPGTGVAATPRVTYVYGASSASHNNGRLIQATDSLTSPTWSTTYGYDQFGHVNGVSRAIGSDIYSIGYAYNSDGTLQSITYPSQRVVKQDYDGIGRLSKLYDSATPNSPFLNTFSYNAAGQALGFAYGNGVIANFGYNDHLQISSISYTKTGQADLLNLTYNYASGANNGQIASITNNADSTKSEAFTYDAWGRLSASQAGTSGATWGYTYDYDRFGNRRNQNPVGTGTQVLLAIDPTTNRISDSGFSYDANGNVLADGTGFHAYTYDAENRMKTVDTTAATYGYDDALRIKKVTTGPNAATVAYVYSGSKVIAEYTPGVNGGQPSLLKEYVYSGSKLVATLTPANGSSPATLVYSHPDHLSTRVESSIDPTSQAFTINRTYGHLPFGETWYETGSAAKWKFTTYEADAESNLNYAIGRYHSQRLGRFMSVDPYFGNIAIPQSLNRYAYTQNDPVNNVDPSGKRMNLSCGSEEPGCLGGGDEDSPELIVDGIEIPDFLYGLYENALENGSAVECPWDTCSGWSTSTLSVGIPGSSKSVSIETQNWVTFQCDAGGACGYYSPSEFGTTSEWNGHLVNENERDFIQIATVYLPQLVEASQKLAVAATAATGKPYSDAAMIAGLTFGISDIDSNGTVWFEIDSSLGKLTTALQAEAQIDSSIHFNSSGEFSVTGYQSIWGYDHMVDRTGNYLNPPANPLPYDFTCGTNGLC